MRGSPGARARRRRHAAVVARPRQRRQARGRPARRRGEPPRHAGLRGRTLTLACDVNGHCTSSCGDVIDAAEDLRGARAAEGAQPAISFAATEPHAGGKPTARRRLRPSLRARRAASLATVLPSPDESAEREAGAHARALPRRAVDLERSVERLDAVDEAAQSLTLGVGAAGAVVDDLDEQPGVVAGGGDDDNPCARVLLYVRERLRDHVVRRSLESLGEPPVGQLGELDRNGSPQRECLERCARAHAR